MPTSSLTLPTGPLPHRAMDHAALRAEAIERLGSLTGGQWTDFNVHDPGITLLEQLCYAITDLGYRANFPIEDLLAGSEDPGLPGPDRILTADPVTEEDLRKVVLDLGLRAARVTAGGEIAVYHHAASGEIRLTADPGDPDLEPLRLAGLHRVLVETSDRLSGTEALARVSDRLQRGRLAGEDHEVGLLDTFDVWVGASLEVAAVEDPVALVAEVITRLATCLAPPPRFTSPTERRAERIDLLYEGPLLDHGTLDELPEPRTVIYTSDLLHAVLDTPQVRAVRALEVAPSASGPYERWALRVPDGAAPRLSADSEIRLFRGGVPLAVDLDEVRQRLGARRDERSRLTNRAPEPTPVGRPRDLARVRSVQRQLPAAYGVGLLGLPASATASRRAQARQLEAYLLVFDQLLANALAQLANAHRLLSPTGAGTRTYFAQPVVDPPLDLTGLTRLGPERLGEWLDRHVEGGDGVERRKRFLAHLLARFNEELGDHARVAASGGADPDEVVVADREDFLRDLHRSGAARGSGYRLDAYKPADEDGAPVFDPATAQGGLERRLRFKLGRGADRRFLLIEHLLLRPVAEDAAQAVEEGEEQIPLLADVEGPDPYSLQVSIVMRERPEAEREALEAFVAGVLVAELPAHLTPTLRWFGNTDGVDHWTALVSAWEAFREQLRARRAERFGPPAEDGLTQLRFRDARDRVIETLGIARTWPLRDIPLPRRIILAPGARAEIPLAFTQKGVRYELRDRVSGEPVLVDGVASAAEGTGGPLALPTPPIVDDVSYRVLAVKLDGADSADHRRATWLRGVVEMEEGVDPSLEARLLLPSLIPGKDPLAPGDARLARFGETVQVEVLQSQEGVTYEIVDDAEASLPFDEQTPLSDPIVGTSGTIVLTLGRPATEDVDLRVRGQKAVGGVDSPERRTGMLDLVLPLRVSADPTRGVATSPGVLDHGGEGEVVVSATQESASYLVWARPLRDGEFVYDDPPTVPVVEVTNNRRKIRVARPEVSDPVTGGFRPGNQGAGTGRKVAVDAGALERDTVFLVQGVKEHRIGPLRGADPSTRRTAVNLDALVAHLVRPDPDVALRLVWTGDTWRLEGGEPGVLYALQLDGVTRGAPLYFHQRSDTDATRNKGVGALRVQGDLVVVQEVGADTVTAAPPDPTTDLAGVPDGAVLTVVATRVTTGLAATLEGSFTLFPAPAALAEPSRVAAGAPATVRVDGVPGLRYSLTMDGVTIGERREGTGAELTFDTGPLSASTDFVLVVESGAGLAVERRVGVRVEVA